MQYTNNERIYILTTHSKRTYILYETSSDCTTIIMHGFIKARHRNPSEQAQHTNQILTGRRGRTGRNAHQNEPLFLQPTPNLAYPHPHRRYDYGPARCAR